MARVLRLVAPVLVLAAGVLVARFIIATRPVATPSARVAIAPAVRVITVEPTVHQFFVGAQGTVTPRTELSLAAEVAGRVVSVASSFDDGGFFTTGDVLLEIDPTDYHLALTRARAELSQAELNLAIQRADAEVARAEWERLNDGDAPPLVAREPQLVQAVSALDAARAAVTSAERDLSRARLIAPFTGRVRSASAEVGQVVARGSVLGSIYAIDYAEIKLPLATDDLAFLSLPMRYRDSSDGHERGDEEPRVDLTAELGGERHTWTGRVVRTDGVIDPTSRRINAIARIDDPYGRSDEDPRRPPLAVGLFVDAAIHGRRVSDVFVLPRAALRPGDQVLVAGEDNRLRIRDVDVIRRTREHAVVHGGLASGDRVVISPVEAPVDGMHVRPHETVAVSGGEEGEEPSRGNAAAPLQGTRE